MSILLRKERPVRIDSFGDEVESIRYFDVETQLSEQLIDKVGDRARSE